MRCYWAWPPRLLNKKTMWWLRMCEVRPRLACRLCTPGPGRSCSWSSRARQDGVSRAGNLHCLTAERASDLVATAPAVQLTSHGAGGSLGMVQRSLGVAELPETLCCQIHRFLARATEVLSHRPLGQQPAAGPGPGPAFLHQGQGSTGPASHYQLARHQPCTLPESWQREEWSGPRGLGGRARGTLA